MAYIIEVKVNQSELTEAIQELLANGWNICGLSIGTRWRSVTAKNVPINDRQSTDASAEVSAP